MALSGSQILTLGVTIAYIGITGFISRQGVKDSVWLSLGTV
jgi:hypothetical protein